MAIKLADTVRPNNYVDQEHLGSFPAVYAEDVWFTDGTRLSEKSFDGDSIQKSELPLASVSQLGKIYQYIGTTGTYKNGFFYECVVNNSVYSWAEKQVSAGGSGEGGHTIEDNGTEMTQRDTLNFVDFDLEDDTQNEKTVVQTHELTQSEFNEIFSTLPTMLDRSNSSNEANNLSLSEKVIGTFVDGKPLYQRTSTSDILPSNVDFAIHKFVSTKTEKDTTLKSLIPIVASAVNNISYSSTYREADYDGWYAFDSNATGTDWSTAYNDEDSWLQWTFDDPIYIDNVTILNSRQHSDCDVIPKITVLGLNLISGEWDTLLEVTPLSENYTYNNVSIDNAYKNTCYTAVRLKHSRNAILNRNAYVSDFRVNGYDAVVTKYYTVEYTKTTDTAVASGEKIVGQWIDGKPIYQKSIVTNALISSWSYAIATGVDKLVGTDGIIRQSSLDTSNNFIAIDNGVANEDYLFFRVVNGTLSLYKKSSAYAITGDVITTVRYTKQ